MKVMVITLGENSYEAGFYAINCGRQNKLLFSSNGKSEKEAIRVLRYRLINEKENCVRKYDRMIGVLDKSLFSVGGTIND